MGGCGIILVLPVIAMVLFMWIILTSLSSGSMSSRIDAQQSQKVPAINENLLKGKIPRQQALIKYIIFAKRDMFTNREIVSTLKSKGWTEDEIKEGFNSIN